MRRYWQLDLADERVEPGLTEAQALDELAALLDDAIRLRLRADVPVAAYLSGGLDSSLLCALAQQQLGGTLQTFSVGFAQQRYDERAFQAEVAAALGTEHHSVLMEDADIGTLLPEVVEHAEAVLLRSAPAPLHKLSGLVRGHDTKVVLTGEGADEVFGGYDLFKEAKVRQFWARRPSSTARPALLGRLYPYLALSRQGSQLIREFYGVGLDEPDGPRLLPPHPLVEQRPRHQVPVGIRCSTMSVGTIRRRPCSPRSPPTSRSWRPLARAQYLEVRTLLSQYLLSSQGDRMLMAHSVEGRFPFLDHRLADFSARLPDWMKLRGLTEKYLLKKFAADRVPSIVVDRPKYPYRAPIAEALTGPSAPDVESPAARPRRRRPGRRVRRRQGREAGRQARRAATPTPSEADNMALVAVATTQLLAERFLGDRNLSDAHLDAVALQAA